jgi:hypothetical protein
MGQLLMAAISLKGAAKTRPSLLPLKGGRRAFMFLIFDHSMV